MTAGRGRAQLLKRDERRIRRLGVWSAPPECAASSNLQGATGNVSTARCLRHEKHNIDSVYRNHIIYLAKQKRGAAPEGAELVMSQF